MVVQPVRGSDGWATWATWAYLIVEWMIMLPS